MGFDGPKRYGLAFWLGLSLTPVGGDGAIELEIG